MGECLCLHAPGVLQAGDICGGAGAGGGLDSHSLVRFSALKLHTIHALNLRLRQLSRRDMSALPTVLYPLTLPALLQHVCALGYTTLIICASRESFLQDLDLALHDSQDPEHSSSLQDLVTPTLYNLSAAQHVKLAFCTSVQALLAYLTAYGRDRQTEQNDKPEKTRLVLVNPLALHASTPSHSAQGLSRTFAAAAETAFRLRIVLHVVECKTYGDKDEAEDGNEEMHDDNEEAVTTAEQRTDDPWAQQVPILNVSARRFGSGSTERSWAGRTVTAKKTAAKWFLFQRVETTAMQQEQG